MKRRKKDPRKKIALALVVILAVFVAAAVVIERFKVPDTPPAPVPEPVRPVPSPAAPCLLPEQLIKGCLLDLGIVKQDVRFRGRTVKVNSKRPLDADEVRKAFAPLKKVGRVGQKDVRHVRITIDGKTWDIIFSEPESAERLARCAIIVDDMGADLEHARILGRIDADLTFAVLPNAPNSEEVARFLHRKGREIMLHMPMQGSGKDPGPGAILKGMTPAEIESILERSLQIVPFIAGVSNHMGSLITADPKAMRLVMKGLAAQRLFYVDSLTTPKSACRGAAKDLNVPFIARDVFLDNERNHSYITSQMQKLVKASLKNAGGAVGICHPYPETMDVLTREVPRLKGMGVEVVRVSKLIHSPGNTE